MSKTNILFYDKNYLIDDSTISTVTAELQSPLSNKMNGDGATINLGGVSYNVDSNKLQETTKDFQRRICPSLCLLSGIHESVINELLLYQSKTDELSQQSHCVVAWKTTKTSKAVKRHRSFRLSQQFQ